MSKTKKSIIIERVKKNYKALTVLGIGTVLIIASLVVSINLFTQEETVNWTLMLYGSNDEQVNLSYSQIKAMTPSTGQGGFFTTSGIINGPYSVKGVEIRDLCDLVGGCGMNDTVLISAPDGYAMILNLTDVNNTPTYNNTFHEIEHIDLRAILIYEQDGAALSDFDGKPLRLALVGDQNLLTEGFYWVKWVNRIQVIHHN